MSYRIVGGKIGNEIVIYSVENHETMQSHGDPSPSMDVHPSNFHPASYPARQVVLGVSTSNNSFVFRVWKLLSNIQKTT